MPESSRDLADEWRKLLAEWESATAAHRAALAGAEAAGAGGDAGIETAVRRLAEVKARMDDVVTAGKGQRSVRGAPDSLVVRTIDLDGKASGGTDTDSGP